MEDMVTVTTHPFSDLTVIGRMPPQEALEKLKEMGEEGIPLAGTAAGEAPSNRYIWPFSDRAWQHTAHAFGFLPIDGKRAPGSISGIGNIDADSSLKNNKVKITLNRFRVADYPGRGNHRVLIDFYARNQVQDQTEDLHFNATYRVRDGERAPIAGYPIFLGLNVGANGLAFHCHTVNVKNDDDQSLLDFLDSDVFKAGLKLTTSLQPAIAPLASMALGLTKSIARRNQNVSVQDFYLGLDFEGTAMGARLAQGDYIAVQIPESFKRSWRWEDWAYDPESGMIVEKNTPDKLVPFNYLVFGVSRYEDETNFAADSKAKVLTRRKR
jgi:hypothetical protein